MEGEIDATRYLSSVVQQGGTKNGWSLAACGKCLLQAGALRPFEDGQLIYESDQGSVFKNLTCRLLRPDPEPLMEVIPGFPW
jgi:hypothetical protein